MTDRFAPNQIDFQSITVGEEEGYLLFLHAGLNALAQIAHEANPTASPEYIKISDALLAQCLESQLLKVSPLIEANPNQSLASTECTLASVPEFTTSDNGQVQIALEDCSTWADEVVKVLHSHHWSIRTRMLDAGMFEEFIKLEEMLASGEAIYFTAIDRDDAGVCFNDRHLAGLERAASERSTDKVATRKLAEGFFPQPDFLDGRYVKLGSHYTFEIVSPATLLHAIPKEFFDQRYNAALLSSSAFDMLRLGDKVFTFSRSNNFGPADTRLDAGPDLRGVDDRLKSALLGLIDGPEQAVARQFAKYERLGVRFVNIVFTRSDRDRSDATTVADLLLAGQEPVYIKGSLSAGGQLVVRLGFEADGTAYIETSSPGIHDLLENIVEHAERQVEQAKNVAQVEELYSVDTQAEELERRQKSAQRARVSVYKILVELITNIEQPIIEKEIPYERLNGARVEFRDICQIAEGTDEPSVTARYCKESTDPVAANISISGRGSASEDVLRGLVAQRYNHLTLDQQDNLVDEYQQQMDQSVSTFAKHYYKARGYASFAVDRVPVWNQEEGKLEFWLLEVQDVFGYSGLWKVDPEAAQAVSDRLDNNRK